MATPEDSPEPTEDRLSLCYETALCVVPPSHLWLSVDRLRSLYDTAYETWPPHVNLVYPFVRPELLPVAADRIRSLLSLQTRDGHDGQESNSIPLELDTAGVFHQKNASILYIHDGNNTRSLRLSKLRNDVLQILGHETDNYQMHMTVGRTEDPSLSAHKFLVDKVKLLPGVKWEVDRLHLLVRERLQGDGKYTSRMKIWGTIDLADRSLSRLEKPLSFNRKITTPSQTVPDNDDTGEKDQLRTNSPYYFNEEFDLWLPYKASDMDPEETPKTFTVSSYNVLAEFEWPPSEARHSLLVKNILANDALADALVLQEVTDGFLSALLRDERVRERYPYTSHGPPDQVDIEPLPSLLNIVVLSSLPFDWEYVSFHRKHKGSVVAKFNDLKRHGDDSNSSPTIVTSVHLTHGLTDGAVITKKIEIQRLLKYLAKTYPENPWIIAGDTNISTSSHSIDAALRRQNISASTANHLASFDRIFADAGLADAWTVSRSETGDTSDINYDQDDTGEDLFEGEQGATYDATKNEVAAAIVGSGFNMRPQRLDRILVRGQRLLEITRFNKFGFVRDRISDLPDSEETYASDHWGVRCVLRISPEGTVTVPSRDVSSLVVPVQLKKAPACLAEPGSVKQCLSSLGVLPDDDEAAARKAAFNLLKNILLDTPGSGPAQTPGNPRAQPSVVIVPVGSYALGVWTSSSDIDVFCIGPFSSSTFFALTTQRIRKASSSQDIKILRRVKANTGLMLELEVAGIKVDLQYCPSGAVAEGWPDVLTLPASNPIWYLPVQTLSKLKALRDVDYLRRSIPDIVSFRLAHRFIKTWAKSRGIYTARFGFLGGIQISILLTRVHKLLVREAGGAHVSVPDLLATFFHHYVSFDWKKDLVFDPLFHRHRLQYTRTLREPLAILGFFPPALNTSHAASVPSTRTIADEFKRAAGLLASAPDTMSWMSFLTGAATTTSSASLSAAGAADFLASFKSYVQVTVSYWGLSPSSGARYMGWLESRLVMLLVDMNRRAPGVYARMWPARFIEAETAGNKEEAIQDVRKNNTLSNYEGYYLIGLDKLDPDTTREEMHISLGALQIALARFEAQIRGNESYYFDIKKNWMDAKVVKRSDLGPLRVDDASETIVGEYAAGDTDDEEEDDEDELELEDEDNDEQQLEDYYAEANVSKIKKKKTGKRGKKTIQQTNVLPILEPGKKFRTAQDVMNRIRWDPDMDSAEYVVGYEDRFLGARERPLDAWKTEQTDEEFIPLHRILYFKRKKAGRQGGGVTAGVGKTGEAETGEGEGEIGGEDGGDGGSGNGRGRGRGKDDGEIVWERKTRRDLIFGSGVLE